MGPWAASWALRASFSAIFCLIVPFFLGGGAEVVLGLGFSSSSSSSESSQSD